MKTLFLFLALALSLFLFLMSCGVEVDSSQSIKNTAEVVLVGDNGTISPRGAIYVPLDSVVSPAVTPEDGYSFKQWDVSGNIEIIGSSTNPGSSLRIKGDGTVTALFEKTRPVLTITDPENGSVTKSPDSTSYPFGSKVTLTASPSVGYKFAGWSGDITSANNPVIVSVNNNKTITATFTPIPGVTGVVYVRKEATGGDGSSWVNAYNDLESAFANSGTNKQIWIAGGEYRLSSTSTGFAPQNDSRVYGGFTGFETSLSERVWYNNFTRANGNHSHDIVFNLSGKTGILLDGIIIENSVSTAVYINTDGIIVENCIVRNNNYNYTSSSSQAILVNGKNALIKNCVFYGNCAGNTINQSGQALAIGKAGTKVENCVFFNNNATAISNSNSDATNPVRIISCTIFGNSSRTVAPGGIQSFRGAVAVRGCILYNNTNTTGTNGTQIDSAHEVNYCCIQDCSIEGKGIYKKTGNYSSATNLDVNPVFNSVAQPSDDKKWYAINNVDAPLIPSNTQILTAAKFSEDTPLLDIRGGDRPQIFDYGAYETPYVGP